MPEAGADPQAAEHIAEEATAAERRRLHPAARLHGGLRVRLQFLLQGLDVLRHLLQQHLRALAQIAHADADLA